MQLAQRLLRVVPVTVALSALWWAATRNNDDYCGTVGECLGHSFDDALTLLVALPLGWLAIRLLRVPRALLTSMAVLVAAVIGWLAAEALLDALDPDRAVDALVPLLPALVVAVVAALVGVVVVGPARSRPERLARFGAPGLLVAAALAAGALAAHVERVDTVDDVTATGLTTYEPVLGGTRPSAARVSHGRVQLDYAITDGGRTTYPHVELLRTPVGGRLCADLVVSLGDECVDDGTSMQRVYDGHADVALVRGDTTLLVRFVDTTVLDPAEVLTALEEAEPVPADELAG